MKLRTRAQVTKKYGSHLSIYSMKNVSNPDFELSNRKPRLIAQLTNVKEEYKMNL